LIRSGQSLSSRLHVLLTYLLLGNKFNSPSNDKLESRSEKIKGQGVEAKNQKKYNLCNLLVLKNSEYFPPSRILKTNMYPRDNRSKQRPLSPSSLKPGGLPGREKVILSMRS
jgi:hypothetical protein